MTRKKSPKKQGLPEDQNQGEKLLAGDPRLKEMPNPVLTDAQRLLGEVQVHQIELEMQNDELRTTELELSEIKDKYLDLFDFAPVGYLTMDSKGIIAEVNLKGTSLLGAPKSTLIGTPFILFLPNKERSVFHSRLMALNEGTQSCEMQMERQDGGRFYAQLEIAKLYADDVLNSPSVRITFWDITQRKQSEEELSRIRRQLEQSNSDLEQFAYVASHDLKEPLRNIINCMQMLEKYRGKLDKDGDEIIGYSIDSAKRMDALITGLLSYSRITTRGELELTDFEEILKRALLNLSIAIEETNAVVTHDSLPTLEVIPTQFLQVFQNLIANAIKFRSDKPPKIHVSAQKAVNEWIFSVKDNGIGIEEDQFERIFLMFQQIRGHKKQEGNGIGLALVKKIAKRHGGRVWVQSKIGQGSTFYVGIPVEPYINKDKVACEFSE
jgi:two-component system, chemotaxis family, sensor kinase Cph1